MKTISFKVSDEQYDALCKWLETKNKTISWGARYGMSELVKDALTEHVPGFVFNSRHWRSYADGTCD